MRSTQVLLVVVLNHDERGHGEREKKREREGNNNGDSSRGSVIHLIWIKQIPNGFFPWPRLTNYFLTGKSQPITKPVVDRPKKRPNDIKENKCRAKEQINHHVL